MTGHKSHLRKSAQQLKTYHAAVQRPSSNINPDELRVYNKVRDLMRADMQQMQQQPPPVGSPQVHQVANPQLAASPLRAYHTHMRHQPRYMGQVCYTQPDLYAQPAYQPPAQHVPVNMNRQHFMDPRTHMPAPIRANAATVPTTHMPHPQPTDDDLIAAGMRYYATQAGQQDFR